MQVRRERRYISKCAALKFKMRATLNATKFSPLARSQSKGLFKRFPPEFTRAGAIFKKVFEALYCAQLESSKARNLQRPLFTVPFLNAATQASPLLECVASQWRLDDSIVSSRCTVYYVNVSHFRRSSTAITTARSRTTRERWPLFARAAA